MTKKRIIVIFLAIIFTLISIFYLKFRQPSNKSELKSLNRNVILISLDALRADHLKCYGYSRNTSPNIDRLAKEGIIFKNAYSQSTYTLLSHISLFTSLYPSVFFQKGMAKIDERFVTLAEILTAEGYRTAAFTGGSHMDRDYGFSRGFHLYRDRYSQARTGFEQSKEEIFKWLEENCDNKFFLFLHSYDTHYPYLNEPFDKNLASKSRASVTGKENWRGILKKADQLTEEDIAHLINLYDGAIKLADSFIGELLSKLAKLKIDKNTLIIITSDHGDQFKEHGSLGHGGSGPYEEVCRVPLIIRGTKIPKNIVDDQIVELIDVMPTIISYLGIPPPSLMQGKNLLQFIDKSKQGSQTAYTEWLSGSFADRSIRMGKWKFIQKTIPPKRDELKLEIYNLEADPQEKNNLIENKPELKKLFLKKLDNFLTNNERFRQLLLAEASLQWHINYQADEKAHIISGKIKSKAPFVSISLTNNYSKNIAKYSNSLKSYSILKNGSFENADNPWAFWDLKIPYKKIKKIQKINNINAAFIDRKEINLSENKKFLPIYQRVIVEPNTLYIFGCRIKAKNLKHRCYAAINEVFKRKGDKKARAHKTNSLKGDNNWKILYQFFKTDENSKQILFFPVIIEDFTSGQVWIDHCFLAKLSYEEWLSNREYHFIFNSLISKNIHLTLRNSKPKAPIEFDLRIDGRYKREKIYIGEKRLNPESIPFSLTDNSSFYDVYIRKASDLSSPKEKNCFYIWRLSPSFVPDKIELSPETIKALKALGYIN